MNRRDLLKIMTLLPLSMALRPRIKSPQSGESVSKHVILIVFDAWSARNLHIFGYLRNTMPNLNKFIKHSTVYHRHYSVANYTVPGTASLLTGTYPWTHRANNLGGIIQAPFSQQQIFKAVEASHRTIAFSQNVYADQFLYQAGNHLRLHIPSGQFNQSDSVLYDLPLFSRDANTAFNSFENGIIQHEEGVSGSIWLGPLERVKSLRDKVVLNVTKGEQYQQGLPESLDSFVLSDLMDGLISTLKGLTEPSFVYFHCFPPHEPYRPTARFFDGFVDDGYGPAGADQHPLVFAKKKQDHLNLSRVLYDAYLASWDAELSRLFSFFEATGFDHNAHIILTSDHGEMFDHGLRGHSAPVLFEPLIHIPLFISTAGQSKRVDVHTTTSSVDLLPTITHLTGNPTPEWSEGLLLPNLGGVADPDRPIYSFDAQRNSAFTEFSTYSIAMVRGKNKIVRYRHPDYDKFEFYDLEQDPEERHDMASLGSTVFVQMREELLKKIATLTGKP